MSIEPLETAHGSDYPCCRQLSVFLENRLGQLLRLTRVLEGEELEIRAISVEGSVDCAIVRLLVNDPDQAHRRIRDAGFAVTEGEVLAVELPSGKRGILAVCAALISAEVNVNYAYAMLASKHRQAGLVIQVDHPGLAASVLKNKQFQVLDHSEL